MRKIVFESLNEVISFTRGEDALSTIGIGQKHLIEKWLDEIQIHGDYTINDDFTINILNFGVDVRSQDLKEFPLYIQFNKINGSFFKLLNP